MKKTVFRFFFGLLIMSLMPLGALAENNIKYDSLWNEKNEYENNVEVSWGEDNIYTLSYGYEPIFILFTEQSNKLTYQVKNSNDNSVKGFRLSEYWDEKESNYGILVSKELLDIFDSREKHEFESGISAGKSLFRHIVKTLDISFDDLKMAFYRMKNEPEYVRDILSYMSDDEFADFAEYLKSLPTPPDFILRAACMEDNEKAEILLTYPGSVYIKEYEMSFSCLSLLRNSDISVEELCTYDLTTDSFVKFISDMNDNVSKLDDSFKDSKGRTPIEKYNLIAAEQQKQLAVETGEELIFIPLAVISLAGAVAIVNPKLRKKFRKAD